MAQQTRKSYAAGHFELVLDGRVSTAFVKSVDGGFERLTPVNEPVGPMNQRIKHGGPVEIDPLSLEIGIAGCKDILECINKSLDRDFQRIHGELIHADFDEHSMFVQEFKEALLTEVTFPTLDGSAKEVGYLKLKLQPEHVHNHKGDKARTKGPHTIKQKMWLTNAFNIKIDGVKGFEYVNKLDSFTIKQSVKAFPVGDLRNPYYEPTKIEFPNLTGTIALAYADDILKWHEESVHRGVSDNSTHKTGSIEFLSPDRKEVLLTIELDSVGISAVSIQASQANEEQIKRLKFELYCESMKMKPGAGF